MNSSQPVTPPLILVAEDDSDDAFFMERAFEHAALPNRLFIVSNGQEALDYLQGKERYAARESFPLPGLLLLDLKMPVKNGFEVLEWLKGHSQFNYLPIVIISGSEFESDIRRAKELGADDFRVKSSSTEYLVKMLQELHTRWLNGATSHRVFDPSLDNPKTVL